MGKVWPIGPNDEPVGWFGQDLDAEEDGKGNYAVRTPYEPVAPQWIKASLFGWSVFIVFAFWWMLTLAWIAFFIASVLFVFASYTTYRAARSHIDDLVSTAWEEVIQRAKPPAR